MKSPTIKDIAPLIIPGIALLVLYKLFFSNDKAQQNIDKEIKTLLAQTLQVQQPTKSRGEWAIIADTIFNDLRFSAISDDKNDALYQLMRPRNDADIYTLIDVFGRRQEENFGVNVGGLKNLPQFVTSNFSSNDIIRINKVYSDQNMKFRF